ncbi:hypothetical protein ACFX13_006751 [Malus domestica]
MISCAFAEFKTGRPSRTIYISSLCGSIAFNGNVAIELQVQLASFLGVNRVERHDRYFNLPTSVGRNKKQTFSFIKGRITKRLNRWKGKRLSSAGRELLVKVYGRFISNNSLLAAEVGHFLHNKKGGTEGFLSLKLDLNKVYNRVKWGFWRPYLNGWDLGMFGSDSL